MPTLTAQEIKKNEKEKEKKEQCLVIQEGKKKKIKERKNKRKRQRAQHKHTLKRKKKKKGEEEEEEEEERSWTWAFLSIKQPHFLPLVFSPLWGNFFLVGLRRKHPDHIIYFISSLLSQTYSKKISFPFSLQTFPSTLFHL